MAQFDAVAASTDEVWKLITQPSELAKWLPLETRVTPGEQGKIFLSWVRTVKVKGKLWAGSRANA